MCYYYFIIVKWKNDEIQLEFSTLAKHFCIMSTLSQGKQDGLNDCCKKLFVDL